MDAPNSPPLVAGGPPVERTLQHARQSGREEGANGMRAGSRPAPAGRTNCHAQAQACALERLLLRVALRCRFWPALNEQWLVGGLELGNPRQRSAAFHHLAAVTLEDDLVARQEAVPPPSLSLHRVGTG